MSQATPQERTLGRVTYWVLGLFGSAVLMLADVLVRAGGLSYAQGDLDGPLDTAAFVAVLLLAAAGFLGVLLARAASSTAVWLLRAAAIGSTVASLNAIVRSHPLLGIGLFVFSALPLFFAAWGAGLAERGRGR